MKNFTKTISVLLLTGGLFVGHAAENANQPIEAEGPPEQQLLAEHSRRAESPEQKDDDPDSTISALNSRGAAALDAADGVKVGFDPDPIEVFDRPYPNKTKPLDGIRFFRHLCNVIPYVIYEHLSRDNFQEIVNAFKKSIPDQNPDITPEEINKRVIKNFGSYDKKPAASDQSTPEEARMSASSYAHRILHSIGVYSLSEQGVLQHKDVSQEEESILNKVFSSDYFGISQRPELFLADTDDADAINAIKSLFSCKGIFVNTMLIENIYQAAKRILQKTHQGDKLVAFGNTPFLIYQALTHLINNDPSDKDYRQLVSFPFSGSPNGIRPTDDGTRTTNKNTATLERLAHLRERMVNAGLINQNMLTHTTYFIDLINTGAGLAYVIDEIISAFKDQGSGSIPKMATISVNKIDRSHFRIAEAIAGDGEKIRLFFPGIKEASFAIDNFVVYLKEHEKLDTVPTLLRMVPAYNAAFWNSSYDWLLTQELSDHQKKLLEYFNDEVRTLKSFDDEVRTLKSEEL